MSEPHTKTKPTLEDLLRLKRAESPTPEFWSRFEIELRQKQLTALVEKRRWWHDLPILLNRRVYVPAGAAAVLAFSLVTVRYTTTGSLTGIENTAPRILATDPAVEMLPATVVATSSNRHEEPIERATSAPQVASGRELAAESSTAAAQAMPARHEISPSARSIAANLARLEQSEPELLNSVLGSRLSAPVRAEATLARAELPEPGVSDSVAKYRLIARYAERALSPEPSAPALVRERIARRLGDDLGDDISRIGVVGSRVSLKF